MNTKFCRICKHDWSLNNFYEESGNTCKSCWIMMMNEQARTKRKSVDGPITPWLISKAVDHKRQVYTERIQQMSVPKQGPLATPCWIWQGASNKYPKLMISINGVSGAVGAHRLSLALSLGYEPGELEASHLCHTPLCVNPQHLVAETHAENQARRRG